MEFHARNRVVDAIQFESHDSLPKIQAFMDPASPAYRGEGDVLEVQAIDRVAMKTWPSLGRQFELVTIRLGMWIVREPDGFLVVTDEEMRLNFDVPEPVAIAEDSSL